MARLFCTKIAVGPTQSNCCGYKGSSSKEAIRDETQSTTMKLLRKRPIGCTQQLVLQWAFAFGTLMSALLIALSVFLTPWITFVEAQIEIEVGIPKTCIRIFNQSNCTSQWQALNGGDLIGTILLISSMVTLLFCLAWFAAIMARSRCTKKIRRSLVIVTISSMLAFMLSLSGLVCIAGHREENTPGLNTLRVIIDPDMISHHSGPSVIMAMIGVWWTFLNTAISCSILYGYSRAQAEYKIPQTNTTVRDEMGATLTCTTTTKTVSSKKKSKRNCTDSWSLLETADKIGVISLSITTALLEIALLLTMLIGCRWYGHLLDFYYTVIRLTRLSLVIGILGIVFALYDGRLGKRSDVTWEQAEGQSYLLIGAMTTTFADLAASLGMHYHKLWIYIFGNVKLAPMQQS